MIAKGTSYFIKCADPGIAAFCKGTVKPCPINSCITGDSKHTPRFCRNTQGMSKQAGIGVILRFDNGSLDKRLYFFFCLEFFVNIPFGSFHLFNLLRYFMSFLDVRILRTFIPSAQKEDNLVPADSVIQPITGAVINNHSTNLTAFRRPVAKVPFTRTFNSGFNPGFRTNICQSMEPVRKSICFLNFVHTTSVDYCLQTVKKKKGD